MRNNEQVMFRKEENFYDHLISNRKHGKMEEI